MTGHVNISLIQRQEIKIMEGFVIYSIAVIGAFAFRAYKKDHAEIREHKMNMDTIKKLIEHDK